MAVTADQVEVVLRAQVDNYIRDLNRADKFFQNVASRAQQEAQFITRELGKISARDIRDADIQAFGQGLDELRAKFNPVFAAQQRYETNVESITRAQRVGAITATEATAAITREAAAMRNAVASAQALDSALVNGQQTNRFNTANIAAQFQDIGVTAAAGMNPLIIALQQGTQLSAVLNSELQQGINPAKALGSAFLQVINPVSLATIATIALGTAAIQYFGTLISQAGPASESLKEQNDRIREVADRWGEAVPALQAYVDQLDRAADAGNLDQAYTDAVARQFDTLRSVLPDLRAELAAARIDIQQVGGEAQEIDALQAAFDELATKVQNNTATGADLDRVLALLATTTGAQTVPSLSNLTNVLQAVSSGLISAANNARVLNDEYDRLTRQGPDATGFFATGDFVAEQQRLNSLTADQLALENEISRVKAQAERDGATALTDAQALALATDNLAAAERRREDAKATKGGAKAVSDIERERQAVVDMIEQLEFEYSLLRLTNEERAVANALRDAGAVATDAQRQRIEELVLATYNEQQAIDQLNASSEMWANTIQSATRGFINDLIEGKSAAEAFSNVLSSIANKLLDVGLDNLFGKGGFNLAGLFGGLSTRATGGPVYAGNPTLVGERGPEVFVPSGPGRIVPNSQLSGGSVTFSPVIDARGADVAAVARLERVVQDMAANVVPAIRREMATAGKKGRNRG